MSIQLRKSEGAFDEARFNDPDAGVEEEEVHLKRADA